ncbi:MAG TPA: NUDIX hydrolase [Streptosporangiaceae bacterium]|nr:NUDIX hydrolase [Streptosporangiaceae bacterium]
MPESRDDGVIRAAGALVWRPGAAGPEIALIHRPRYDDWSYPKGKCERGEHVLATAIREVTEETGLRVILGRPLTPSVYRVGGRVKRVSYWAARYLESVGFVPGHEVDQVTWLPAAQARERLSYQRDVDLLDEFLSGPAKSVPFILTRHVSAGRKRAAGPDDLARPLDPRGVADAKLLAGLLTSYGSCRVISSAAERCVATVRPYAAAVGVPVEIEPAFTVTPAARPEVDLAEAGSRRKAKAAKMAKPAAGRDGAAAQEPVPGLPAWPGGTPGSSREPGEPEIGLQAARRVGDLAASGVPTVICAHRENLPWLTDAAFAALGAAAPSLRPLRKGAFLVVQSAGGVFVSSEQHDLAS